VVSNASAYRDARREACLAATAIGDASKHLQGYLFDALTELEAKDQRLKELSATLTQIASGACTSLHHAEVVAGAVLDEELMRQVRESAECFNRGDLGVPFSQVQAEARARRKSDADEG
jgi:hypothetical protein